MKSKKFGTFQKIYVFIFEKIFVFLERDVSMIWTLLTLINVIKISISLLRLENDISFNNLVWLRRNNYIFLFSKV